MRTFPIKALLACLLLTLLVFQQATACYDGHAELEPSVAVTGSSAVMLSAAADCDGDSASCDASIQTEPEQGCNHCCHCHAGASLCLPAGHFAHWALPPAHWLAVAGATFPHEIISALYRPPIA